MTFTEQQLKNLKREATMLKKSLGITQTEALDRVAVRVGFPDWRQLATAASRQATEEKP